MATTIVMPQMGYDMKEGTVVRWHKKEGEPVARGEVLADIETDKATVEFEAFTSGVLRKIVAQEGVSIPVGQLIAVITAPDEPLPDDLLPGGTAAPVSPVSVTADAGPPESITTSVPSVPAATSSAGQAGEVRASPIARRLARDRKSVV